MQTYGRTDVTAEDALSMPTFRFGNGSSSWGAVTRLPTFVPPFLFRLTNKFAAQT